MRPQTNSERRAAAREADAAKARFEHVDGDHLTLLNAYHAYKQNETNDRWAYDNFLQGKDLFKFKLNRDWSPRFLCAVC